MQTKTWAQCGVAGVGCAFALCYLIGVPATVPVAAAGSCDALVSLNLAATEITSAKMQPASAAPASCRVAATLRPTSDSEIKMELWMPSSGWNGKYQAVGNGAF